MAYDSNLLAPYHGSEPFIFISYSHRNADRAEEIIHNLNRAGFRVWYDEGLIPGREWDENIARIIMGSSYFIALISQEYLASSNCKDELNFARDKNKPILLIYLDEIRLPAGMELRLGRLYAVHRSQYSTDQAFYAKVFSAEGISRCNRRFVPSASSGTVSSSRPASSARSSSAPPTAAYAERTRSSSGKVRAAAEPASSGSGLQVFGVILLLTLLAGTAVLLYHLFSPGNNPPAPPSTPSIQTVEPTASTEAELDIEATPTPSPTPEATPTPTVTPTPELTPTPVPTLPPVPTPEEVVTPAPDPSLPPDYEPTPTPDVQFVDPLPPEDIGGIIIIDPDNSSGDTFTVESIP